MASSRRAPARRSSRRSFTTASTACTTRRPTSPIAAWPSGGRMVPRGWLLDTATLYARVFRRGARLALTNWPVGLMVVAYGALLGLVTRLVAPLGIIGGFVLWFVRMACLSSWLSPVEQVIRSGLLRLGAVPCNVLAHTAGR